MAWQEKTLEAKYTSPSGKELPFLYEKVARDTNLKTGVFEFPDRDGAHVQHQGAGAKSFPLTCIFTGSDCMDQADAFEMALCERGVAQLLHPVYGPYNVIPTSNIKREDDLVSALNESRVTITFTETIVEADAPMDAVSADEIKAAYEELLESAANDFAENISVDTVADELVLQSMLTTQIQTIDDDLRPTDSGDSAALAKFKTISGEVKSGIKSLKSVVSTVKGAVEKAENFVAKAMDVARLTLNLMKLPSQIAVNVMEKVKSYSSTTTNIVNQFRNDPFGTQNIANAYHSTSLVLSGCVASLATGAALDIAASAVAKTDKSVINRSPALSPPLASASGGFSVNSPADPETEAMSREESVQIINNLLSMLETTKSFQDSKIENNIVVDANSNTYILLNELVYSCVQLITNVSLSLPMRRTITLDQDRQLIELVCELYGSVDYIDKFIADNDLSADEIEVLPMGREVTYHVQIA